MGIDHNLMSPENARRRYFPAPIIMGIRSTESECGLLRTRLDVAFIYLSAAQQGAGADYCALAEEVCESVVADVAAALGVTVKFPSSLERLAAQAE